MNPRREMDRDDQIIAGLYGDGVYRSTGEGKPTAKRGGTIRFDGAYDSAGSISMPAIQRVSVLPTGFERQRSRHATLRRDVKNAQTHSPQTNSNPSAALSTGWRKAASRRRAAFAAIIMIQTAVATWSLGQTFPYPWLTALETATLATFAILFAWISFGFWTFMTGLWLEWRRQPRRFSVNSFIATERRHHPLSSKTAILMPICNENVERVFAGLETTYRSLAATGQLGAFTLFVLSDSSDPDVQVEEELAWANLCRKLNASEKIFYRHRRNNIKRKSGNIADFLRRWGRGYDYMIVLDADSVMTGEALIRLARIMEEHPQAGIVQTLPTLIRGESLFARMQQFASRVYGPMLAAGMGFLQLGESYYWGHNAILRVAPFMEHCILPRLRGTPPFGGEILSHDFVEAALMGRAGLEVWIVEDIAGSYEETPPTLQDELKRDRRWCQGNLQHLRLMFGQDIRAGHRTIFLAGIMTYASALFWLVFLGLSSVWIAVNAMTPPVYFSPQPSLFPIWPQWRPEWAIALFSTTALLLFTPKFLALALIVRRGQAALYGGIGALTAGIFIEIVLSALLAPVRMWFHAKFVLLTLLGRDIKWGAQQRTGNEIGWIQAFRMHGFSAGFALAWMAVVVWLDPAFSWWLVPITGPLVGSTALSVYLSRDGRRFREARLLLIPDELEPSEAVKSLEKALKHFQREPAEPLGLMRLIADPSALALHLAFIRGKAAATSGARARNRKLREEILRTGPGALRAKEKAWLLLDADSLKSLQEEFWRFDNLAPHPGAVTLARHPRRGLGPRAHARATGSMGPVAESWQK